MRDDKPTRSHEDQALLAQQDVLELMARLGGDGFDARAVLAGVASGMAIMVGTVFGPGAVSPWFANQARVAAGELPH